MADVAARAGVSIKTVSRVVNGELYVAGATVAKVDEAVRALGFRANLAAATLARGSGPGTLGLVIGDVANPFYAQLAAGVEQVAVEQRCVLLVSSSGEDETRECDIVTSLADRGITGLVAVPATGRQDWLERERARGLAVVFVDRPAATPADCVLTDNVAGAHAAVAHLLDAGRRRLAFVGNDATVYTSTERLAGFRAAHRAARVRPDPSLQVLGPRTVAQAEAVTTLLLARPDPPDAVFAQNDLMAMGVWRAVHAAGADVAIVGFDDFELADVLDPPVTVVVQDAVELGRRAARLLFGRLAGEDGPPRTELVPTRLVVR